jgi:formylglycine-generating enzyme required for sulfatase activity
MTGGENPSHFKPHAYLKIGNNLVDVARPAENMTYNQSIAAIEKLNAIHKTHYDEEVAKWRKENPKSSMKECPIKYKQFRLPTEFELEYAIAAGTSTTWSHGNDENQLHDYAHVYRPNTPEELLQTLRVGMKKPNPWGFYDMHGQVWEMTSSMWDPNDPNSSYRVVRGGSWRYYAEDAASSRRGYVPPGYPYECVGFRLVMEEKP